MASKQLLTIAIDPPPTVRLLTPKAAPNGRQPNKSKGCAFLEFATKSALQQALKSHQSELDGRMINVELTAGGGGKSEGRIEKLKKRNKELHEQRVCILSLTKMLLSNATCVSGNVSRSRRRSPKLRTRKRRVCRYRDHNGTQRPPAWNKHRSRGGHGV